MDYYRAQTSDETLAPMGADNNSLNIACDSYAPDYWSNTYVNGLSPMKQIEGLCLPIHFTSLKSFAVVQSIHLNNINYANDDSIWSTIRNTPFSQPLSTFSSLLLIIDWREIIQKPKTEESLNRKALLRSSMFAAFAQMLQFISRDIGSTSTWNARRLFLSIYLIFSSACVRK